MTCIICCNSTCGVNLDSVKILNEFCEIFTLDPTRYAEQLQLEFCQSCTSDLELVSGVWSQLKTLQDQVENFKTNIKEKIRIYPNMIQEFHIRENVQTIRNLICKDLSLSLEIANQNDHEIENLNYNNILIKTEEENSEYEDPNLLFSNDHDPHDYHSDSTEYDKSMTFNDDSSQNLLKIQALKNNSILRIKKLEDMKPEEIKKEMSTPLLLHLKRNCKSSKQKSQIAVEPRATRKVKKNSPYKLSLNLRKILPTPPRKPYIHSCGACDQTFTKESDVVAHRLEVHNNQIVKCTECPKMFKTRRDMKMHVSNVHLGRNRRIPRKICEICGKAVKIMAAHITIHQDLSVNCEICGKVFKNKQTLATHHGLVHSEKKREPMICPTCGKTFVSAEALKSHEDTVHAIEFKLKCEVCQKGFQQQCQLKVHMLSHSAPSFKCPQDGCDRVFKYKRQIKEHMRIHTGDRPYKCKICCKGFRNSGLRNVHETIHTPHITRAECEICGKKFTHKSYLKAHLIWHRKVEARGKGQPKPKPRKSKQRCIIINENLNIVS